MRPPTCWFSPHEVSQEFRPIALHNPRGAAHCGGENYNGRARIGLMFEEKYL